MRYFHCSSTLKFIEAFENYWYSTVSSEEAMKLNKSSQFFWAIYVK